MKLRLSVLFIVMIITSSFIGVSYAYTNGDINIRSDNRCEYFRVGIKNIGTGDPGPNYLQSGGNLYPQNPPRDGSPDPQWRPGENPEGKNVASSISKNGKCLFRMMINGTLTALYEDVYEELHNIYPWYATSWTFLIANGGRLPVQIEKFEILNIWGDEEILNFSVIDGWTIWIDDEYYDSGTPCCRLKKSLREIILQPQSYIKLYISLHFKEEHIDPCGVTHIMPQDSSVNWKISIRYIPILP